MFIVFPLVGNTFKSGSKSLENDKLNTFNPLKTDITTNNANVPTMIPNEAIPVIILIALLLLLLKRYLLAMYSEKFKLKFLAFV